MKGKLLSINEVNNLPIGTKVVVSRVGDGWIQYKGDCIETVNSDCEGVFTEDSDRTKSFIGDEKYDVGFKIEYYEYIEHEISYCPGTSSCQETIK